MIRDSARRILGKPLNTGFAVHNFVLTTGKYIMYTQNMASLQRHVVKGHTYWRIVESRRVNGKPRAVPLMYLGSADSLLQRLLEEPTGRLRIRSFQHGDVAALSSTSMSRSIAAGFR